MITNEINHREPNRFVRLAVQDSGRLSRDSQDLLDQCGLDVETASNSPVAECRNYPLSVLYSRAVDIPSYVAGSSVDLGIVGRHVLLEHRSHEQIRELLPLGFGRCQLVLAVPREARIHSVVDMRGLRIATPFPRVVRDYFAQQDVSIQIVETAGTVEVAPTLGVADVIADVAATGSALLLHDLRRIATIMESEALLVASPQAFHDPGRLITIERLLLRIKGVLGARSYKYVMMNAPRSTIQIVCALLPSLRSPTIMNLADPDWVAIHAVIEEHRFWDVIEQLSAAGASEILVTSIEKLMLE